jgi:hypothetical protein
VEWTNPDQNKDRWRAVLNTVMNLRFSQTAGNFLNIFGTISFLKRILFRIVSYSFSHPDSQSVRQSVSQSASQSVVS